MYNSKFHCPRQSACLQNGSLFYTLLKTFKPIFKDSPQVFIAGYLHVKSGKSRFL